ncbi:MAG: SDR family NAD(P)-dependent oxidoreductase [Magnetococcales bacterium]|nr:SDR family NAD(P)-dependent oxidoreductase [Magnetococcales bacterium]
MARQERSNRSAVARLVGGVKGVIMLALVSPFLLALTPLWFIHRWSEQRAGREAPLSPLALYRIKRRQAGRPLWYMEEGGDPADVESRGASGYSQADSGEVNPPASEASIVARSHSGDEVERGVEPPVDRMTSAPTGVALVTGGARRLGGHMVQELARMGWPVAIACHHSRNEADALAQSITDGGGQAVVLEADLTNPAHCEGLLNEAERALGPVTLLINNAAWFQPTPLENASWEVMGQMLTVNLHAPLWLGMRAAERMKRHGEGLIINMADIWGLRPLAGHALYSASKAGLVMATQAMARDLAPKVRVNAIAPGGVLAPEDALDREAFRRLLSRTPLSGKAGPEAVIPALHYLLSSPFVTGEVLSVDGGRQWV